MLWHRVLLSYLLVHLVLSGCGPTRDTYPIPTARPELPEPRGDSPLDTAFENAIDWMSIVYDEPDVDTRFTIRRSTNYSGTSRDSQNINGRLPLEQFSELDRRVRVISDNDLEQARCTQLASPRAKASVSARLRNGRTVEIYNVDGTTECFRGRLTESKGLGDFLATLCDQYLAE